MFLRMGGLYTHCRKNLTLSIFVLCLSGCSLSLGGNMSLKRIRSYRGEVLDRLPDLNKNKGVSIEFVGTVDCKVADYPLFCVTIGNSQNHDLKDVFISAGVHGGEPAGVYALLRFLENDINDFTNNYRFLIFLCVNPFGFEHDYRFNAKDVDVNRQFKSDTGCYEASKVIQVLARFARKFTCTIDLHETNSNWSDEVFTTADNPGTFYMWETASDKSIRIGDRVVEEVKKIVPVCDWAKIYGDTNHRGVIWYPEGCGNPVYAQGTTLDAYLNANYTPQSFTLETPCEWSMEERVRVNIVAVRKILELKLNA